MNYYGTNAMVYQTVSISQVEKRLMRGKRIIDRRIQTTGITTTDLWMGDYKAKSPKPPITLTPLQ